MAKEKAAMQEAPPEPQVMMPVSLTPEQEWEVINTSGFDQALNQKIKKVRASMNTEEVKAPQGVETNVNDVYVKFSEEGAFLDIAVGKNSEGSPQVSMKIPSVWLEGS